MRDRLTTAWRRLAGSGGRWATAGLAAACAIFMADAGLDRMAVREFRSHVSAAADAGGGVLFVMSPADCRAAAEVSGWIAEQLDARGLGATGLVVRDGPGAEGLSAALEAGNTRFPHVPISSRAARAFAGLAGTPVVLGISADRTAAVVERVTATTREEAALLVERLLKAQGGGA